MSNFWYSVSQIESNNNQLFLDNIDAEQLVAQYGSPLYVYMEDRIKLNAQKLINAFTKYYGNYQLLYAIKANNNLNILKTLCELGVGADASCINEIKLAKLAGFADEKIFFTAVFPSNKDILLAKDSSVILNLENIEDVSLLADNPPELISFRINPDITSCGDEGLKFAGPDAKFGISSFQALDAYRLAKNIGVKKFGAHIMTGSNILDAQYFAKTVKALFDIIGPIAESLAIEFDFINIGGSMGIPYQLEQEELDVDLLASSVSEEIKNCAARYNMPLPKLYQEPGRFIVADAGILLSKVNSIKKASKNWLGIDAGMNTLLRPALYKSYHHIIATKEIKVTHPVFYNIVGPICENTDIFALNYQLPEMFKGDIIALLCTGAYGYGMSSQYNTQCRPAEIYVSRGKSRLIRRADQFEDLYSNIV